MSLALLKKLVMMTEARGATPAETRVAAEKAGRILMERPELLAPTGEQRGQDATERDRLRRQLFTVQLENARYREHIDRLTEEHRALRQQRQTEHAQRQRDNGVTRPHGHLRGMSYHDAMNQQGTRAGRER